MEEYQQSIVGEWNEIALGSVREGGGGPTKVAWSLMTFHTAVFDAWAAYDPDAVGVHSRLDDTAGPASEAAKAEAVSYAAFTILSAIYPDAERVEAYREFMTENGFDPDASPSDPGSPAAIGIAAAQAVLAHRATDRSNYENDFEDTSGFEPVNAADPETYQIPGGTFFNTNFWQPLRVPTGEVTDEDGNPIITDDPASFKDQIAITPHWGNVKSFSLIENDMLRPQAPPHLGDITRYVDATGEVTTGDQAYRDQFSVLVDVSANLTDEQKLTAEYWADGPRTEQPPGHWNQIAQDIAKRDEHSLDDDVKMFFALNNAIFDAGVATWETKYVYDYIRPQSAIRDLFFNDAIESFAGPNQGTQTILGSKWIPYQSTTFVTPPFPEYVSGHSTFSRAAAETLIAFTGSNAYYDGVSTSNHDLNGDGDLDLLGEFVGLELFFEDYNGPPIPLRWDTLLDAADDAGLSRIFGGIHIQDGDLFGRELGAELAPLAWDQSQAYINGTAGALLRGASATDGDDLVQGSFGDDTLVGLAGNDVFRPGSGDDDIDGGEGVDTVEYAEGEVTFEQLGGGTVTVTRDSGVDILDNVEVVQVGDKFYRIDFGEGQASGIVSRLYHQAFGRDSDPLGQFFWTDELDNGFDPVALAELFLSSDEFLSGNQANLSNCDFVDVLYQNLRGSSSDAPGKEFWTGFLDDEALTRAEVLLQFSESNESIVHFFNTHLEDSALLIF